MVCGFRLGDAAARGADDDRQLALPVDPVVLCGDLDIVVGAGERGRELGEDRRELRFLLADLGNVVPVVQPDAVDLDGFGTSGA